MAAGGGGAEESTVPEEPSCCSKGASAKASAFSVGGQRAGPVGVRPPPLVLVRGTSPCLAAKTRLSRVGGAPDPVGVNVVFFVSILQLRRVFVYVMIVLRMHGLRFEL